MLKLTISHLWLSDRRYVCMLNTAQPLHDIEHRANDSMWISIETARHHASQSTKNNITRARLPADESNGPIERLLTRARQIATHEKSKSEPITKIQLK